jgi:hypothetical protein
VFILITVLCFFLWVMGLLVLWMVLNYFGISSNIWTMIEAMSTAITAAAVFGAGFIAYRELTESLSSRHLAVVDRLFDELNSPVNIEARRWVYQHLPENPDEGIRIITPEGRAAVKQVLNSLDHVAFLTQAGWIPEDIIMPWMHPMIYKSWEKLEPYITCERQRRNEPYYYQKVSELAKRCSTWRQKNMAETSVKWISDAL